MNAEQYVDFRGHRYTAPWRCLCCGADIDLQQFVWGRMCPYCDMGRCEKGLVAVGRGLRTTYEAGHGTSEVLLAAPIVDPHVWCGCMECPHEVNAPQWLRA